MKLNEVKKFYPTTFETENDYGINKYGKYQPNLTFIISKKEITEESLKYTYTSKVTNNMNLDFNGTPKILFGHYWKSRKGTNCFRITPNGNHYLIQVDWGGTSSKSRGYFTEEEMKTFLYYRRASSSGGGSGYTYIVVKKDYKQQINLEDI